MKLSAFDYFALGLILFLLLSVAYLMGSVGLEVGP